METNMKLMLILILLFPLHVFSSVQDGKKVSRYNTTVIADHGGVSISEYIPVIDNEERRKKLFEERSSKKLVNGHFPVRSDQLTVGRLSAEQAAGIKYQMISQPLFIIGYDKVSINWLKANRGHLTKNKAIGLVVNVESSIQMDELQQIVGTKIRLQPTPGNDIATHLKISNYPFYMDRDGVMR